MKMLGAKEMKHVQPEEEEKEPEKKGPKGGNKKQKKRGVDKYTSGRI